MLCQAPRQYGFSLCYCVEQTARPVLDLYEGCFHLIRMLRISVVQVVPPIEPIQATSIIVRNSNNRNNKNNRVQSLPRIYVLWVQKQRGQGEICISGGILIYFCSICLLRLEICGQKGVTLHIWGNAGEILAPIKVNGKTPMTMVGPAFHPMISRLALFYWPFSWILAKCKYFFAAKVFVLYELCWIQSTSYVCKKNS